jgi:outer membrane biogenesis lipoprotein LolB
MKAIVPALAIAALALAACSDNADRDATKSDTLNSQPVEQNPQIDRDPTPDTGTGGEQQGTEPSQPAGQ